MFLCSLTKFGYFQISQLFRIRWAIVLNRFWQHIKKIWKSQRRPNFVTKFVRVGFGSKIFRTHCITHHLIQLHAQNTVTCISYVYIHMYIRMFTVISDAGRSIHTFRMGPNRHHFTDDIIKFIFLSENCILFQNALRSAHMGQIYNRTALVLTLAHICVTRPRCGNSTGGDDVC